MEKSSRVKRTREDFVRQKLGGDARRTVEDACELPALARLILAFSEAGIRFQVAGMSAAVLQGVPATTLDTDLWIDLPERAYTKILGICRKLGAEILAQTVVALTDDSLVNFLYRVDGLGSFEFEYNKAVQISWFGMNVSVLPLPSLIKSKRYLNRPKDVAHLPLLEQTLKLQKRSIK